MNYQEKIATFRKNADVDGAFDFMKNVFTAEENQKIKGEPTDYLHDDDELEEKMTPAQGFEEVVKGFQPEMSMREKIDWLFERMNDSSEHYQDRWELAQVFKPLNAFKIRIGDYERCDAVIDSGHYDPQNGTFERLYGLNHTIIFDEDSKEEYDFVYELKNGDQYRLHAGGEAVPGPVLYYDLKVTLFSKHLVELVDSLTNDDRFAALAKKLPFYFLIESAEYRDENWCYELRKLDETSLEGNDHKETFLESVIPDTEPTPEQRYDFYAQYAHDPETPEFDQFVAVCRENRACFERLVERGQKAREAEDAGASAVISGVLWRLADTYPAAVLDFHNDIFQAALPSIEVEIEEEPENEDVERIQRMRRERGQLEKPIRAISDYIEMLQHAWSNVPEDFVEQVRPARDEAWERLRTWEHPVAQVLWREAEAEAEAATGGTKKKKTRKCRGRLRRAQAQESAPTQSAEYIAAVVACADLLPTVHQGYGGGWDFVMDRLTTLGERASAATPKLLALLRDYTEHRFDVQLVSTIGEVLYALGTEEVPPEVHRGHERNQFMFEYYKDWVHKAPTRYWNEFVAAWEADAKAFESPEPWEQRLHDSDFGYELFAKQLRELDEDRALSAVLAAARKAPGPRLTRLLVALARGAAKAKRYDEVARFLENVPDPTAEQADDLAFARVAVLLQQLESQADGADALLVAVKRQHPKNATLLFLDVDHQVRARGAEAGMRAMVEHVRTLTEKDIVYRKAFHEFTEDPSGNFQPAPRNVYPLYRLAHREFRRACFTGEAFDGDDKSFRSDPFYRAFYKLADVPADERQRDIEGYRQEFDFLKTISTMTDAELLKRLDPEDWHISMLIAERLVESPTPDRIERLVAFLERVVDDDDKRKALAFLLWPHATDEMLKSETFQPHIPWLAWRYPGSSVDLTRSILERMSGLGLNKVITRIATDFEDRLVLACFKSFLNPFIAEKDFAGAQKLLRKVLGDMSPKKPDWVLVMSNLAVMHVQAGEMKEAEAVFDELFAQDFSRFDYEPGETDDLMEQIMGSSLDKQLVAAFETYYRMARFNQACLYALTRRPEKAVASLREAVSKGHYTAEKILAEGDFRSLHGRPDFNAIVRGLRQWNEVPETQQLVRIGAFVAQGDDGGAADLGQFLFHRDHVYVASGTRVLVLDASEPTQPKQVGQVELQKSVQGLAAKDGVLYVSEWTRALNLIDIADPTNPRAFDCVPLIGTTARTVERMGDHLVVSCGRDERILLLNISDPRTAWRADEVRVGGDVEDLTSDGRRIYVANDDKGLAIYEIQNGKLVEVERALEGESFRPQRVFVGASRLYVWGHGDDNDRDLWVLERDDPSEVLAAYETDLSTPTTMREIGDRAVFFHSHSTCSVMEGVNAPQKLFRQYDAEDDGRHVEVREGDELEESCRYSEHPRYWEIREGRLYATQGDDGFQVYEFRPGGIFDR